MPLAIRATADELMDADDLDPGTYAAVMADLARVNRMTLAARPTLDFLARVASPAVPLKILDVGFGDGDMLRRIARWAAGKGRAVDLTGIDLNPRSAPAATAHTPDDMPIRYLTGDYTDLAGEEWDCIISSLVAHHMSRRQLTAFLRFMDSEGRRGWFINDLERHSIAHRGFPVLAALMRWHPIVRHDGTVSVARSYRAGEWPAILADAGVESARVRRYFPFRLCVERLR